MRRTNSFMELLTVIETNKKISGQIVSLNRDVNQNDGVKVRQIRFQGKTSGTQFWIEPSSMDRFLGGALSECSGHYSANSICLNMAQTTGSIAKYTFQRTTTSKWNQMVETFRKDHWVLARVNGWIRDLRTYGLNVDKNLKRCLESRSKLDEKQKKLQSEIQSIKEKVKLAESIVTEKEKVVDEIKARVDQTKGEAIRLSELAKLTNADEDKDRAEKAKDAFSQASYKLSSAEYDVQSAEFDVRSAGYGLKWTQDDLDSVAKDITENEVEIASSLETITELKKPSTVKSILAVLSGEVLLGVVQQDTPVSMYVKPGPLLPSRINAGRIVPYIKINDRLSLIDYGGDVCWLPTQMIHFQSKHRFSNQFKR